MDGRRYKVLELLQEMQSHMESGGADMTANDCRSGGQAFPLAGYATRHMRVKGKNGMTMRQYYKGMALMGYNAHHGPQCFKDSHDDKMRAIARDADMLVAEDDNGEG